MTTPVPLKTDQGGNRVKNNPRTPHVKSVNRPFNDIISFFHKTATHSVTGGGLESPGGNGGPLEAGGESHAAAGGDGQAGDGRHGVFYKYTVRLLYVVSQFIWSADNIMIKIGFIIITCFQVMESNLYSVGTYGVINAFLKQS